MKKLMAAPVLLALAACGTPQQQCIGRVSQDMVVLDHLIAETQANIARGYGYTQTVVSMPEFLDCTPTVAQGTPAPAPQMCLEDVPRTISKPVALDLAAEAAKLDSMQKRRAEMAQALAPAIADCQARYPK